MKSTKVKDPRVKVLAPMLSDPIYFRPGICIDGPVKGAQVKVNDGQSHINIAFRPKLNPPILPIYAPPPPLSPIQHVTYKVTRRLTQNGVVICEHQP